MPAPDVMIEMRKHGKILPVFFNIPQGRTCSFANAKIWSKENFRIEPSDLLPPENHWTPALRNTAEKSINPAMPAPDVMIEMRKHGEILPVFFNIHQGRTTRTKFRGVSLRNFAVPSSFGKNAPG